MSAGEGTLQLKLSPELKRRIQKAAFDNGETLRAFVLTAVRDRGVEVDEVDLRDRRGGIR